MVKKKNTKKSLHGQWSNRWMFILAATGSAVGLGNIWKFPYITGENGGGAFVLVYLVCIALIGLPIMMAEILMGKRGRESPVGSVTSLAEEAGAPRAWRLVGWAGVVTGFLILSYYSVIAGWTGAYVFRAGSGSFVGTSPDQISAMFSNLVSDPERLLAWHTLFIVMTMLVVARGVQHGLEKFVRYLMPGLLIILLVLVGYALSTEGFQQGLQFLFSPDWSELQPSSVLIAMGHAFFTLSLGMGSIMAYGSYLPDEASIASTSVMIVIADTVVALLAGMAIFPIVFSHGLEPAAGPGLIFQTLPNAFGDMPGGTFFGMLFFVLLLLAAWTSAISLIEPAIAWMVERLNMTRVYAAVVSGLVVWAVGLLTVFSFNLLGDFKPIGGKTLFDLLDYLTANIMLPLGGVVMAVFVAWVMTDKARLEELPISDSLYKSWLFVLRFIAPLAVVIVCLHAVGLIG